MEHEIRSCGCLHVDETTLRVQRGEKDKLGLGKASVDYLWAMLGRAPDGSPVGVSFLYVQNSVESGRAIRLKAATPIRTKAAT
jgi:hypothetical protein